MCRSSFKLSVISSFFCICSCLFLFWLCFVYIFSEWLVNQHRDSAASYIGHYNLLDYFALVENETRARTKFNLLEVKLLFCIFLQICFCLIIYSFINKFIYLFIHSFNTLFVIVFFFFQIDKTQNQKLTLFFSLSHSCDKWILHLSVIFFFYYNFY